MSLNINDLANKISIPAHLIKAMTFEYLSSVPDARERERLQLLVVDEPNFRDGCFRAVLDAMVMSTLLLTLTDDEEFEDALNSINPLDDPVHQEMRLILFTSGIEVGLPKSVLLRENIAARTAKAETVFAGV